MYKVKYLSSVVALGSLVVATAPSSAGEAKTNAPAAVSVAAIGGATCGSARLCAYIGQNTLGTPVFRSKGVAAVSSPTPGVTCIRPTAGAVKIGKIVPLVTVEWGQSLGSDLLAFYEDSKVDCPSGTLEVRQYDLQGNLNPRVAFDIVAD